MTCSCNTPHSVPHSFVPPPYSPPIKGRAEVANLPGLNGPQAHTYPVGYDALGPLNSGPTKQFPRGRGTGFTPPTAQEGAASFLKYATPAQLAINAKETAKLQAQGGSGIGSAIGGVVSSVASSAASSIGGDIVDALPAIGAALLALL
jgi:hypothetical protein